MKLSFIDPQLVRRIEGSPREKDLLRAALGKDKSLQILDCTAGLCRDSLRMAYWGHTVTACERNPGLAQKLLEAYAEASAHEFYKPWISRLKIIPSSTEEFVSKVKKGDFDLIVIDPMFASEGRSALPKREMQELKALLEVEGAERSCDNAAELLEATWDLGAKKILLKRPLKAAPANERKCSCSYRGRAHRWDLYLFGASPRNPGGFFATQRDQIGKSTDNRISMH